MFSGVPTKPAGEWHGARADSIHRLQCRLPGLKGDAAPREMNRCGLLLDASSPLRIGSSHRAAFEFDGFQTSLPLRVTHVVTHFETGAGAEHRIGFAFRLTSAADEAALEALLGRLNTALAAAA